MNPNTSLTLILQAVLDSFWHQQHINTHVYRGVGGLYHSSLQAINTSSAEELYMTSPKIPLVSEKRLDRKSDGQANT